MDMKKYIMTAVVSLALFAGQAHAQRCLPGMNGIEVRADMADGFYCADARNNTGYSFGAALSKYAKSGNKWVFGGEYLLRNSPYGDTKIPVEQFTAETGYYFNVLSDVRKTVFFYVGTSVLSGYEVVNHGKKLLRDGAALRDGDAFVYGGALSLDMELYLSDRIALLAGLRERCLWGGDTGRFHTQYGIGIKFIIN